MFEVPLVYFNLVWFEIKNIQIPLSHFIILEILFIQRYISIINQVYILVNHKFTLFNYFGFDNCCFLSRGDHSFYKIMYIKKFGTILFDQ